MVDLQSATGAKLKTVTGKQGKTDFDCLVFHVLHVYYSFSGRILLGFTIN